MSNKMTKTLNDVLQLVVQGYSNGAIAKILVLSEASVKQSIRRILKIYNILYSKDKSSRVLLVKKYYSEHKDLL